MNRSLETALLAALAIGGCVSNEPATVTSLQSLKVTLRSPDAAHLGTVDKPIAPGDLVVDVTAYDAQGKVYGADMDVDAYISFGGNKVGQFEQCGKGEDSTPLATLHLAAGHAEAQTVRVVRAYGRANLWLEEHVPADGGGPDGGAAPSKLARRSPRAFGSSPELIFSYPKIADVQMPLDLTSPTATYCSQFNGKQVDVLGATGTGSLIVTSVFSGGYVVADTGAAYDPATGTGGFNHMYVFTFGKPPYFIQPGRVLSKVSGNVSKFVGFTELNFPYQEPVATVDLAPVPAPVELGADMRGQHLKLLRLSAATVKATGKVCPINPTEKQWVQFNEFALDFGDGICDSFSTIGVQLGAKTLGGFDPLKRQGHSVTVTGMLRNNSGQNDAPGPDGKAVQCYQRTDCAAAGLDKADCVEGTCKKGVFNFWNINPRDATDVMPLD